MPFSRAITDTSVSSSFGHPTWIGHIILASLVYALMDETTLGLCSSALELLFNLEMRCLMTQRTECKQMLWIDHSTVVLTCQCLNDSYTKNKELPASPFSSIMSNRAKCVQTRSSLDERQFVKVMIEGARVCETEECAHRTCTCQECAYKVRFVGYNQSVSYTFLHLSPAYKRCWRQRLKQPRKVVAQHMYETALNSE